MSGPAGAYVAVTPWSRYSGRSVVDVDEQARLSRRDGRYQARSVLWQESALPRVRACGLHLQPTQHDGVTGKQGAREPFVSVVRTPAGDGYRAGLSGVQSCGSTWSCPVCSEKIQAHRKDEVAAAIREAHSRGWSVGFLTFTVRHSRRHSLAGVWGAVSTSWRAATSGSRAAWSTDRDLYGVAGYVRLVEVTHGFNGWHVHVHALVMLDPAASSRVSARAATGGPARVTLEDVQLLGSSMFGRWKSAAVKAGRGYAPSKRNGVDARLVLPGEQLAGYFAKNVYDVKEVDSAAFDVTTSHAKQAKHGNVTPFGLLARLVRDGDAADLDRWHEWERTSKGRRQLLWSNGLRAELGADAEVEDQDVVDAADLAGESVAEIPGPAYRRLARRGWVPALLSAAEVADDGQELAQLLDSLGESWERPGARPEHYERV